MAEGERTVKAARRQHQETRPAAASAGLKSPGEDSMNFTRRNLLAGVGGAAVSRCHPRAAGAESFPFTPNQRYPDPAIQILDPSFGKYRLYSSTVEQVASGMRWAEGPADFPE